MGWTKIDRAAWAREAFFRHYHDDVPCFYSMTVSLDVTRLRAAMVDGEVGVYDMLSPCYTVFHPETETFSNLWTTYSADYAAFLADYEEDVRRYGKLEGFMPKPGAPEGMFTASMLPWATFEGFHLELPRGNDYLLPIFTMGRMHTREGRTLLPLAIQAHHAVCDGFHACRLAREVQALLDAPEAWRRQ